ncbi:MAG: DNA polymerase III subunit alpha [Devosia sp.]
MFAELAARSNFDFLQGASHPEELTLVAKTLGLSGFGLCDRNTVAGVVRGHLAARQAGLPFVVGCRLSFMDDTPDILAWPIDRAAYGRLCRLLTVGNMRGAKGDCRLLFEDLLAWCDGLILALVAEGEDGCRIERVAPVLKARTDEPLRLALNRTFCSHDTRQILSGAALAKKLGLRPLATNLPLYHAPERKPLQDALTAIGAHTTLERAGRLLQANAERHIKSPAEMMRLFADLPEAVAETQSILQRVQFSLEELRYEYPEEPTDPGRTPQETLARLTADGARRRYPKGLPEAVERQLAHELSLIKTLDYARYFLTVYDVVRFARERGILAQGRGSAANSAVCFCLGITEVDPGQTDLLFERFISPERREPPDIDVDFEHERREEVIQYIYEKYGRERAGLAATVITYRARSAARELGKALGFSEDAVSAVAGSVWGWSSQGIDPEDAARAGLDPRDHRIGHLIRLSREIAGFPRHLSQHVGGFVITRGRLDELVPIVKAAMDDRTTIEWDKDDLEALGMLKIDVLALGMLTCLRKGLALLAAHYRHDFPQSTATPLLEAHAAESHEDSAPREAFSLVDEAHQAEGARKGQHALPPQLPDAGVPQYDDWPVTLATIPPDDQEVYEMICRADTLGVFQIESRAQMTMLPRLRPKNFYDLVIEVAIVRPGPIQGDMVHPYLRRRQGKEKVTYPSKELEQVLAKTLGVPLFQEQAMRIAIVAAGFTPAEADQLRRAMATFKKVGTIGTFQQKMIDGMKEKGYDPAFAERCFKQIEGFGEYGFPESHAASFALLVYASCWLKCHYPDVFCAALLNSQPMGFYAPAQIVRDARHHGVEVRPVDINLSQWDCVLEPGPIAADRLHKRNASMRGAIRSTMSVRLGFRQVKGLGEEVLRQVVAERGKGYDSVRDLWLRTGLPRATIERLADADAFGSLGLGRRDGLWAARGLDQKGRAEDLPLFAAADTADLQKDAAAVLPPMPPGEEVINDYRFLSLSLRAHPAQFVRHRLLREGVRQAEDIERWAGKGAVSVCGLVLVRQRPGSAKGVIFMTLEDESGIANVIVWPKVFERYRQAILGARFVMAKGRVQAEDGVVHLVANTVEDRTHLLTHLTEELGGWDALDRADEVKRPTNDLRFNPKARSRLSRLIEEAPELSGDLAQYVSDNRHVLASLEAHAVAAAKIDPAIPAAERMAHSHMPPLPSSAWGSGRMAATALGTLGQGVEAARTKRVLPKGRNFH